MDTIFHDVIIVIVIFVICKLVLQNISKVNGNRPPGPRGWPVIGYLPFLGPKPYKTLMKMRLKYGSIIGIKLGRNFTVVLGDLASIKEAFSKNELSARPLGIFQFNKKYHNVVNMRGKEWQNHTRTMLRIFRDLGIGKSRIEEVIQSQVSEVIAKLEAFGPKKDVNIEEVLSLPIDNIIYSMMCNKTFEHADPMKAVLHDFQVYSQRYFSSVSLAAYFPWIKPLLMKFHPMLKGTDRAFRNLENALSSEIAAHEKNIDEDEPRDFIDYFLKEIASRQGQDNYNKLVLNGTSQILLMAGSETSRVTLEWGLMYLAKHQDIQEKAYQEIVKVIGTEKPVAWSDRQQLPYNNALMMEIQRRKTLVPLNVIRCPQNKCAIGGYDIENDTFVLANLWAVHMDPNVWDNPKQFNPERFLQRNGEETSLVRNENFIPFSYGPRMCPGERLATMQLSIIMPRIIQRFRILPPSDGLDFTSELRVTILPKKPFLKFEKR